MTRTHLQQGAVRWAGLITGSFAWMLNTQLGQILPAMECNIRVPLLAATSWVLALLALAAGYASWSGAAERAYAYRPHTERFAKALSALAGVLFAFALLLQGSAALVLNGCER